MKRKVREDSGVGILFMIVLVVLFVASFFFTAPDFNITNFINGTYQEKCEEYANNQFIAQKTWAEIKVDTEVLLGIRKQKNVYITNSMLATENNIIDNDTIKNSADMINTFASTYNTLNTSIILVPNKAEIYKEDFSSVINRMNQSDTISKFGTQVDNRITKVDVATVLNAHKKEPIYYKSDRHWTPIAAKYVFNNWLQLSGLEEIKLEYTNETISDNFIGDLGTQINYKNLSDSMILSIAKEDTTKYVVTHEDGQQSTSLYNMEAINKDPYAIFLGEKETITTIDTDVNTKRRLLIFKDSYANCYIPYLIPYYNQITIIDPEKYYGDINELIEHNGYTDILFLYEVDAFFQNKSLSEVLQQ